MGTIQKFIVDNKGEATIHNAHETLSRKTIYEGSILTLHLDEIRLPNGAAAFREYVEHGGGVAVLALWRGDVLLVRQYRHPVGQDLLELPAGKLEPGEDPTQCAIRELEEETGYRAGKMIKLGAYYATPGYVSELLHLYVAEDLVPTAQRLDSQEFLEVVPMPMKEALVACRDGRIVDAKTALALLLAQTTERHFY